MNAELIPLDIIKGDQHTAGYAAVNPQRVVPTLIEDEGHRLVQSLAILEYLEECHPAPPLLPNDARARAYVRALALTLAGDSHPFVTPRVRQLHAARSISQGRTVEPAGRADGMRLTA